MCGSPLISVTEKTFQEMYIVVHFLKCFSYDLYVNIIQSCTSIVSLCLKNGIFELPLRAGLKHAV